MKKTFNDIFIIIHQNIQYISTSYKVAYSSTILSALIIIMIPKIAK